MRRHDLRQLFYNFEKFWKILITFDNFEFFTMLTIVGNFLQLLTILNSFLQFFFTVLTIFDNSDNYNYNDNPRDLWPFRH